MDSLTAVFIIYSTILMAIMGFSWSGNRLVNVIVKLSFIAGAVMGLLLVAKLYLV